MKKIGEFLKKYQGKYIKQEIKSISLRKNAKDK
jgi:hypothetical protein